MARAQLAITRDRAGNRCRWPRLAIVLALLTITFVLTVLPVTAEASRDRPVEADSIWSEQAIDQAFQRLESRGDLQRVLPDQRRRPPPPPTRERRESDSWDIDFGWLKAVLPYIAMGLIALVIVLMFPQVRAWLNRLVAGLRYRQGDDDIGITLDEAPADDLLAAADRLAADGQYSKACGLLLRHILPRLAKALNKPWHASITAREALRKFGLPGEAKSQLADVVRASETGQFAGGEVGRPDYDRARTHILSLDKAFAPRPDTTIPKPEGAVI